VARGWESKSVEAQPFDASENRQATTTPRNDDPAQAERQTLMLARTRALADLQLACAPAHRAMLEQAIAALDERIAAVNRPT
jgi:hypothetical protein